MSGQHRVNLKIVCKENYKYEVQEKSPANQAVTMQQLAEEYWRSVLEVGGGGWRVEGVMSDCLHTNNKYCPAMTIIVTRNGKLNGILSYL